MTTYRKQLKDKDGNNVIPVIPVDIITITGSYGDTTYRPDQTVILDVLESKAGTKLTTDGYGVTIGAGVSKVLVSANLFTSQGATKYAWYKIMKNNSVVKYSIAYTSGDSFGATIFTPILVDVNEGDFICIKCHMNNSIVRATDSYLTVQAVI